MKPRYSYVIRHLGDESGSARWIVLVLVFLLGVVASSFWFSRHSVRSQPEMPNSGSTLSAATKAVLKSLDSPMEVHFYSVLDTNSVAAPVQAFAGRVDQLLSQYQQESAGKLDLKRFDASLASAASAASTDGITPFNLDKGEACYLGIALVCNGKRESLARLTPEWESALESDLSRAIEHLAQTSRSGKKAPATSPFDITATEEVKRTIPNLASVSLEEASKIIRESALKEFKEAAAEMEAQVKEAQQRLSQAQNGGSEADQREARQHLIQIQADQMDKLKEIAAKSQAQIQALQKLKAASP